MKKFSSTFFNNTRSSINLNTYSSELRIKQSSSHNRGAGFTFSVVMDNIEPKMEDIIFSILLVLAAGRNCVFFSKFNYICVVFKDNFMIVNANMYLIKTQQRNIIHYCNSKWWPCQCLKVELLNTGSPN